jgi:soluble lytic murein transglycosylase-like protein
MKKSLLALYAFSLVGFAMSNAQVASADLQIAQFVSERVDEALGPVRRVKEKVKDKTSSRLQAIRDKIDPPVRRTSSSNASVSSSTYNNPPQIEPEISPVQSSTQYEDVVEPGSVAYWQRPANVSRSEWAEIIASVQRTSKKTGIPEQLILSLVNKESGFNPRAVSRTGAIGLTQIMPSTAMTECGLSKGDLTNIGLNIDCGIGYLDRQIKYFKRVDLALAAYNAGPGAVKRAVEASGTDDINIVTAKLKPETKPYVRKILARMNYSNDFI